MIKTIRTITGAAALAAVLVFAAPGNRLEAKEKTLYQRLGGKKAITAVAASMLTAIYFILRDGVDYNELGANHFDRLDQKKTITRLTRRLEQLGYAVELKPAA